MLSWMMDTDVRDCHLEMRSGAEIFLQAMRAGKVQLAHFILVALGEGAVNACVEIRGRTLLMCAAELPHTTERVCFMQLLLGRGADVQRQDETGRAALSLASQHGYLDAVRLLVLHGADLDTPDYEGKRPLDYAAQGQHSAVVKFLLKELKKQEAARIIQEHRDLAYMNHIMRTENGDKEVTLSGSSAYMEKFASWEFENSHAKPVWSAFSRGLSHFLCRQSLCDLFLTDNVICNPYALEYDEEKKLKRHKSYFKTTFPSFAQLSDQMIKSQACYNFGQKQPRSMRSNQINLSMLYTNSVINKPSGSFWKWMTPKMVLHSTCSSKESQINLLVPEVDVLDNSVIHCPTDEEFLVTPNTILRNHRFLEEDSQWVSSKEIHHEGKKDLENMERHYLSLSGEGSAKSVESAKSFHLFSHCQQNYVHTTSNVFGTHRRHTYPELRLSHRDSETDVQMLLFED